MEFFNREKGTHANCARVRRVVAIKKLKQHKKIYKQKETTSAQMCTDKGLSLETLALPTDSTTTTAVIYLSECQVHNQLALFSRQRYFLIVTPAKMRSCFFLLQKTNVIYKLTCPGCSQY